MNNGTIINLALYKKNKNAKWLLFFKKDCLYCKAAKEYFEKNNINCTYYDLETAEGIAMAAACGVINECKKWVPVIIKDEEKKKDI